jgi:hypothetical protein
MSLQDIKERIIASNPSREYIVNGEIFTQTDEEYEAAIDARAKMEYEQQIYLKKINEEYLAKTSAYKKLGLTETEIDVLLSVSKPEVLNPTGGN